MPYKSRQVERVTWDPERFRRAAVVEIARALRVRGMRATNMQRQDLQQEAMARALEKYDATRDPNELGPIVLIRWKAIDVVSDEAARREEDEVVLDERHMAGVWA